MGHGDGFEEVSADVGLTHSGWWFALVTSDIDNDGDEDLIAGNLGLNYKYKAGETEPFEIYASDFDQNGTGDIVLSYCSKGKYYPVRGRECSSEQLPHLIQQFPSYTSFAQATTLDLLGSGADGALHYKATNFASGVYLNEGGKFKFISLPIEAQLSSINAFVVHDFNNDTYPDLLAAGNLFSSEVETPRNDASYGIYLTGNGDGHFTAVNPMESGFCTPHQVQGLVLVNSRSGSHQIVVGNNDEAAQVFTVK